jgi:hypothetical protein
LPCSSHSPAAVAATHIGGKQIKDGSITGKDIKNDSLTAKDITGQLQGPRGPEGQRGPQGPAGQGGSGGANVSYQIAEGIVTADGFTTVDALLPCRAGRRRGRLQRDPAGDRASLGAERHGRTRRGLVDGAVRGRRHPADAHRGRGVRGLRQRQRALRRHGGPKAGDQAWLRFGGTRRLIAALELPWAVSRERCSNHEGFYSYAYAGAEYSEPIFVGGKGTFRKTVDDRYRDQGTQYAQTVNVVGKVTDEKVSGTIEGRVRMIRPNGSVVRCTFGPQRWVVFD